MAKTRKPAKQNQTVTIVDQSITVRAVDRTPQTLSDWKQSLVSAESVIQPVRRKLYDLYASVILDDQLISTMGKRRRAISRASITFQINGDEVDVMTDLIEKSFFRKLLTYIIDARLYGYSLILCDLLNETVDLVPRAHVIPSKTMVVNSPYDQEGIDYSLPPYNRLYMGVGEVDDFGLLFPCAYCVLLKRNDISDWAGFNEKFGEPLRIGKFDPHDSQQKAQLTEGLDNMGRSSFAVIPQGAEIEIVEANKTATGANYELFAARMDKAISKIMIGQTMTTDDGSSKSQAEVHERVADEVVMDDLEYVIGYLNEKLKPMLEAQGFPVSEGKFVVIEEEARISKKDRLEMDKILNEIVPIDVDYWGTEYNVPVDMEALKKRQAQADKLAEQPDPTADPEDPEEEAPTAEKAKPKKEKPDPEKKELAATDEPSIFSIRSLLKRFGFFVQALTRQ